MIVAYSQNKMGILPIEITPETPDLLDNAIWIDLISPTKKEEKFLEKYFEIGIPTKEEMKEIEPSSRLYQEDNCLFMTATMVAQSESLEPKADAVTFILTEKNLITIRYIEPQSFKSFISRLKRFANKEYKVERLLLGLLESTTDRLADILENVSHQFDAISLIIFHPNENQEINYKKILQDIGANGDLCTKARESLISFNRLVSFLEYTAGSTFDKNIQIRLKTVTKDVLALSDYASFISSKVNFLLDATLGMVNIEQNNIIKIFSVAAVIFLPPTLIASIYGMNFKYMPELHWAAGYPFATLLMLISAWLPFQYFKKKKWL